MTVPSHRSVAAALLLGLTAGSAASSQSTYRPGLTVEATIDLRRRGLSWSHGRPTLSATGYVPVADLVEVGIGVTALRGSARHGGADALVDLSARHRRDLGAFRLSGGLTGHVFAGAGGLSYAEGDLRLGYLIGPVALDVGATYAPRQAAIGGDDLYLAAGADIALPGTPWTLRTGVGRSSGMVRDAVRAARLRPAGRYWDYSLAIEHIRGRFTAGAKLTATSISGSRPRTPLDDRHAGTRLAAYLRFDL